MEQTHELIDFLDEELTSLEREYKRIQKRVKDDPGTAGDRGEENWASILRAWLPSEYHIVTKGQILGHGGTTSPQVDIVILHPSYPPTLRNKKLYLAEGVSAAFECKVTLRKEHIEKATRTCQMIKRLAKRRPGTPELEMQCPLQYGLLAHSHEWKSPPQKVMSRIDTELHHWNMEVVEYPWEMLDLFCIADLACWSAHKFPWLSWDPHICRSL
jgi:hypothetical protein